MKGLLPLHFYPNPLTTMREHTTMDSDKDIDKTALVLKHGYCHGYHCGKKGIPQEDHSCPYSYEIHGDADTLCNCCEECEKQCAYDI